MNDRAPAFDSPDREEELLASSAMRTRHSRGRQYPEIEQGQQTLYQLDRDRIVHSTAFRRLMHKMQVLVTQTNDHYRTRLTHTIEVAHTARTVARQLGLNEDLVEAIALSHDLGHPPFGHAGEKVLDDCMAGLEGFEHNRHALRIVDLLEYSSPAFPGLNLSWEVREAMAQHSSRRGAAEFTEFLSAGSPLLEAQVADAADSLAYDAHDVDDALSAGLISPEELQEVTLWRRAHEAVRGRYGDLEPEQFQPTIVRTLIDWLVQDLLENTRRRSREERIECVADVRAFRGILVEPSPEMVPLKTELEAFLRGRVYHDPRIQRVAQEGGRMIRQLFAEFCRSPQLLPERHRQRIAEGPPERVVCDYVAGMTDRYAQEEYRKLFVPYTPG
jgi:dGTPase